MTLGTSHPLYRLLARVIVLALVLQQLLVVAPAVGAQAAAPVLTAAPAGSVPLLVKFRAGVSSADIEATVRSAGGQQGRGYGQIRTHVVYVPANAAEKMLAAYQGQASVERASKAVSFGKAGVPNDPQYAQQWALPKIAWDQAYGSVNVAGAAKIAVLDTGVDAAHPDLAGRLVAGQSFVNGDANSDPNGHGTALAGIAAANVNDATGMAGVAYAGASVAPVQVLGADGVGLDSDIVGGVLWAADNGAKVILMGFSSPAYSAALADAVNYAWGKGAVLVAATGNDGSTAASYPAGMPNVIGVAATDQNDAVAASSNTGSAAVAAPGAGILATQPGGGYGAVSGTSASSAEVAGLAALLLASGKSKAETADQIRGATDPVSGQPFGRINVSKALGATTVAPPSVPVVATPTPGATPVYVVSGIKADLDCTPNPVNVNNSTNCTVTLTDGSVNGTVTFSNNGNSANIDASGTWSSTSCQVNGPSGTTCTRSYTPRVSGSQTLSVKYQPGGTGSASNGSTTLAVNGNRAPTANTDTPTIHEDSGANTVNVLANDSDLDNDALTITGVTQGSKGTVTTAADSKSVIYTPNANVNGSDSFTYTISDGKGGTATATVNVTITPVNDAPSFTKGTDQTVAEDAGAQTVSNWATNISFGPANESGQTVSFTVTNDNNALFSVQPAISSTGTLTYTPAANANGSATVTVVLQDNGGTANGGVDTSAAQTFTITVNVVNDAPVLAANTGLTVAEGGSGTIGTSNLQVTDVDNTPGQLTYTVTVLPANGTLYKSGTAVAVNGTFTQADIDAGKVTYTHNGSETISDGFTFTVSDGADGSISSTTFSITVTPVNDAPVANDDGSAAQPLGVGEDSVANTFDVLINDTDADNTSPAATNAGLTIIAKTDGANGTVAIAPDGRSLTYTPNANYNGADSFTYTISDNGATGGTGHTSTATVYITVTPVNDAPVAVNDSANTNEDTSVDIEVVANDADVDNANSALLVAEITDVHGGTATLLTDGRTVRFTPSQDANSGQTGASFGFSYKAKDGTAAGAGVSNAATVTITVNAVNDAPVVTTTVTALSYTENDAATAVDSSLTVSDVDSATLVGATVKITGNYVNGQDTLVYTAPAGNSIVGSFDAATGQLTLSGTASVAQYQAALRAVTYANSSDSPSTATRTVTFTVNDGATANSTGSATRDITVTAVNDAPVATAQSVSLDEDATTVITLAGTDVDSTSLSFQVTSLPAHGTLLDGTHEILATELPYALNGNQVTYRPTANYNGPDSFTFKADDRSSANNLSEAATVTITVNAVNDKPSAADGTASTTEDSTGVTLDLAALVGDTETADANLTYTIVAGPTVAQGTLTPVTGQNGAFTFVPAADFNGTVVITYSVTDRGDPDDCGVPSASCADTLTSDVKSVTITVTEVNDTPVANTDTATVAEDGSVVVDAKANDSAGPSNESAQTLTVSQIVVQPTHGTASVIATGTDAGKVSYSPTSDYNGADSFTYKVCDNGTTNGSVASECAIGTVNVTVTAVNDKPTAAASPSSLTMAEDAQAQTVTLSGSDVETAAGALTFTITQAPSGGVLKHGTTILATDSTVTGSPAELTYTPNANYNGADSFKFTVADTGDGCGGTAVTCTSAARASDEVTVGITVTPVNDAPVLATIGNKAVDEGTLLTFTASATDVDGDTLTFSLVGAPEGASITSTGAFSWTPTEAQGPGSYTFMVKVSDGQGGEDTETITITVAEVNQAPVLAAIGNQNVNEGSALTFKATATDDDMPTNSLTFSLVGAPEGTSITSTGAFNWTPTDNGTFTFTVKVTDNGTPNLSDWEEITVNVANVAPTATINGAPTSSPEGTAISLTSAVSDPGTADAHTYAWSVTRDGVAYALPAGTVTNASTFTFTPNDNGSYVVSLTVTDDDGGAGSDSETIAVTNVAPTATLSNSGPVSEGSPVTVSFSNQADPSSADMAAGFRYAFACDNGDLSGATYATSGTDASTTCTFADNGVYTVKARIIDKDGGSSEYITAVTVNNVAPAVNAGADTTISEGGTFTGGGSFADPGADTWTATVDYGDGSGVQPLALNADKTFSLSHTYADNGTYTVTVCVKDDENAEGCDTVTVTVNNVKPTVSNLQVTPGTINEGGTVTLTGTITDPGSKDSFTLVITWGDGSGAQTITAPAGATSFSVTYVYADDNPTNTTSDVNTVNVTITDKDGGSGSGSATVTVNNVAPVITGVTGPTSPIAKGAQGATASVTVKYTDVGTKDTHTCTFDWNDSTTPTTVAGSNGSCTASHTYAAAGVYTVKVTVTDDDTGSATAAYEFVVVYDPNGGFVTGGGWINSPAGAWAADPTMTGRANFGFVSKYQKGATIPTGETEFQFKAGNLNFHSTAYEWLVISGGFKAQYKGTGTINGQGSYGFLVTAIDGQQSGGNGADKFRIKIWDKNTGLVVYDNQAGQSEDSDAATAISGGSIVVHTK